MKKKDDGQKRATFNVLYPPQSAILELDTHKKYLDYIKESPSITSLRVRILFTRKYFENITFAYCQFFNDTVETTLIKEITFKNCYFHHCFISSVNFEFTRFENCRFQRVDFSRSQFNFCVFDDCKFEDISCYNAYFISTEVDAKAFFNGIVLFKSHYEKMNNTIKHEFYYNRLILAKSLYNSNSNVDNHFLADKALVELKRNDLKYKIFRLQTKLFETPLGKSFRDLIDSTLIGFNLFATKGGTSISKLIKFAFCFIFLINIFYVNSNIIDSNLPINKDVNCINLYLNWLPRTLSIFLAYGYGFFKSTTTNELLLTNLTVITGLITYALMISVFIRKIYK